MKVPARLQLVLETIAARGGTPLLVGGSVRDSLLGCECKDYDVEVFGLSADDLQSILATFGRVDAVGVSFGILKMDGHDFSLPRRESKEGRGHKGFIVQVDPTMTIKEACSRRDFTINSMAFNPLTKEYIDPFDGRTDLDELVLKPTSDAFKEDPLRVLRGMQFAGRFDMVASLDTIAMSKEVRGEYDTLAKERVWGEWEKWAAKSTKPSKGLVFLYFTGWLSLYPTLNALMGCPQDPIWHPEGDAFMHTLWVVNAMASICNREGIVGEDRVVMMMAALCHDIAKPPTTAKNDAGRWTSHGHCEQGGPMAKAFLDSIGCLSRITDKVVPLVQEHLAHVREGHTPRTVRRLAMRLHPASLRELAVLIEADHCGRPPLSEDMPKEMGEVLEIGRARRSSRHRIPAVRGSRAGWSSAPASDGFLQSSMVAEAPPVRQLCLPLCGTVKYPVKESVGSSCTCPALLF